MPRSLKLGAAAFLLAITATVVMLAPRDHVQEVRAEPLPPPSAQPRTPQPCAGRGDFQRMYGEAYAACRASDGLLVETPWESGEPRRLECKVHGPAMSVPLPELER